MNAALQCLSHTPVMNKVSLPVDVDVEVRAALRMAHDRTQSFAPDLMVLFGADHFNGVMHDMMPPFCIGAGAQSLGDYGTVAGPLPVPTVLAVECARAVLEDGVDTAVSHRLRVDHGFTQALELLTGGIDRVPVLPIFINCIGEPLTTVRRVRLLGEAIGRYLAREHSDKRILIVGSGGISHDPPIPSLHTGSEVVRSRLINGIVRTPDEQRLQEERVVYAARAFAKRDAAAVGAPMAALNPEWDRRILSWLCQGDFAALDGLTNAEIVIQGGKGAQEIRTWIAAFACLSAIGRCESQLDYYRAIPDWIAGFAVAHGHLSTS
jgi:2,3-dihydroxyphenylpropionate 1,2-dioxygenase